MGEGEARQGFPAPLSSLGEGLGVRADLLTLAAEADRRLTRIEQLAAQASQEVSRLGSRWRQFVENLVEPAVVQLFQARGIEMQETYRRLKSKRPAAPMEIDNQQGLFVIRQRGDAVEIANQASFQPTAW